MKNSQTSSALRLLSLLLVVLMVSTLAACGDKPVSEPTSASIIENNSTLPSTSSETSGSDSTSSNVSGSSSGAASGSTPKDTRTPAEIQKEMLTKMVAAHQQNEDIVGYLYAPGTTISEPVVQTIDNDYYLRRTYQNKNNFDGCYYVDFRAAMGNRTQLSKNTVIYGHSMDDNPDGTRFSQTKKYLDKGFATDNQFIYFSTPESDMVWQVFAVFPTSTAFNYNNPDPSDVDFLNLINDARKRSRHNYNLDVTASDKILTLSTCTYAYDKNYPNEYRHVVMAKLLPKGAALTPVKVETNPSPKAPK